ncbi:MAG: tandem-95 repeat protein, partial [Cyclobacteriaceae bacterium]
ITVIDNDFDPDGSIDATSVQIFSVPTNGVAIPNPDGSITYTPNPNFAGSDNFTYNVKDNLGAVSNFALVDITINPINDPPIANADAATTSENAAITFDLIGNDFDVDGTVNPASITIVTQPTFGNVVPSIDGTVTYTPNNGFSGTDTFTYTVRDNNNVLSNQATVTVTTTNVNVAPVANDDAAATIENVPVTINLITNDSDDSGIDPASLIITSLPTNGVEVNNGDGTVEYTPNIDFNGIDSFTYTVDDIEGLTSNEATVTITVDDVNQAPIANDEPLNTTNEDTPITIDVIANDIDPDPEGFIDPLTLTVVANPSNGSVQIDVTGTVTYTPNLNFNGNDSLTYRVKDDDGALSNVATVPILVNDINDAPIGTDDIITTDEEVTVTINILENDSDIDGTINNTTVGVITNVDHGILSINADGSVEYTPEEDYNGLDTFTYTVEDDDGTVSNIAKVDITIQPINDLPVANDDAANTDEDVAVAIDVLLNDTDVDGTLDASSVVVTTPPTNGQANVEAVGSILYIPDPGYNGPDSFAYTVKDDLGGESNQASVVVSINEVNDPLVANDDEVETDEDTSVSINLIANDIDSDGTIDPASIVIITDPINGTVLVNSDGTVIYTPTENYFGEDNFNYTVNDNSGATSNIANVQVTVNSVNDPPVAIDDQINTDEDMPLLLRITENDFDLDGTVDSLSIDLVNPPVNGIIEFDSVGNFQYIPDPDYFGSDSFNYTVKDDQGATSNPAIVTLNIKAINDAPRSIGLDGSIIEETKPSGTLIGVFNTVDPDNNDTHIYSLVVGEGSDDNSAFIIEDDQLKNFIVFDFEEKPFYSIRVKSDDGIESFEDIFEISIGDLDENIAFIGDVTLPSLHMANSGSETFSIDVKDNIELKEVTFNYKGITEPFDAWKTQQLTSASNTFTINLPEASFDAIGLIYQFVVVDIRGNVASRGGTTYISYVGEGLPIPKDRFGQDITNYDIISIPLDLSDESIVNTLEDDLGEYDKSKWRLFTYENGYREYNGGLSNIRQGQGYWLIVKDNQILDTGAGTTELENDDPFKLHLERGWNMIGNPYNFDLNWLDILSANGNPASVGQELIVYNRGYESSLDLARFRGGFVFTDSATTIEIPFLRKSAANGGRLSGGSKISNDINQPSWEINLVLEAGKVVNRLGAFGMHPEADLSKDRFDRMTPPKFLDFLDLEFAHPEYFNPAFSKDIVPNVADHVWEFSVESNVASRNVQISWGKIEGVNEDRQLMLYDVDQERVVNMNEHQNYTFSSSGSRDFRIYFGSKQIIKDLLVPERVTLGHPYPNPFSKTTIVPFSVPNGTPTFGLEVAVYNVWGGKVRTLIEGEYTPGFYQVEWNGYDETGNEVAPGMYLFRLIMGDNQPALFHRVLKQ